MTATGWCVLAVLAAALVLVALILLRVRLLASQVGSFECALRRPQDRRWMSGVACFGDETVEWYRLISLSWRPKFRMPREDMVLTDARRRGTAGRVVDVACQVGQARYDLGMLEDSHSALVAWLESAAPTQPRLF
ncbi:DUF2550 family protein [Actinomyces urogenitalis]|uniref:DUF2550 family protein n=1 Tax=Actinomyces urogenitalis TaxID=103621 RepID=UPI002910CD14|nr:DUF2550 family protein [Actinomyces urogenitalis]MDU5427921.1 DUF2550 family protein [Actinomyces urogenitalis]